MDFTSFIHGLILNDNLLLPHIQEEFLTKSGEIDEAYLSYLCKQRINKGTLKAELNKAHSRVSFGVRTYANEVSSEEFFAEYEFGKYDNVREWISHFKRTHNKLLTRGVLYDYILGRGTGTSAV